MKVLNLIKSFSKDESGAVTVDWVVLTAAIVGLGLLVIATIGPAIEDTAGVIVGDLQEASTR
jgi:Flp pilus assembly pilin Flp